MCLVETSATRAPQRNVYLLILFFTIHDPNCLPEMNLGYPFNYPSGKYKLSNCFVLEYTYTLVLLFHISFPSQSMFCLVHDIYNVYKTFSALILTIIVIIIIINGIFIFSPLVFLNTPPSLNSF